MNAFPDWLVLCVWRALMGEVYPAIRAIANSLSDDRELLIRSVAVAISEQGHAYAQWFPAADQTALRVWLQAVGPVLAAPLPEYAACRTHRLGWSGDTHPGVRPVEFG